MTAGQPLLEYDAVGEPWWDDAPVFIIGGGPSLIDRDLSDLGRRGYILGVNRAAEFIHVHATFTLDMMFVSKYVSQIRSWAKNHEVYIAVPEDQLGRKIHINGARYLQRVQGRGLAKDPHHITNGLNSGFGAINLAVHKKARCIYLLGFDMKPTDRELPTHWHGGYTWHDRRHEIYYGNWAKRLEELAKCLPGNISIFNANPDSAITAFNKIRYEDIGVRHVKNFRQISQAE